MKKSMLFLIVLTGSIIVNAQNNDTIAFLMQQYDYRTVLQEMNSLPAASLGPETLYLKATALKALSRFPEAIGCLEQIYRADSGNLKIALELADCYKSVLNFIKPQEIYEIACARYPGNPYLLHLLAGVYFTNEHYAQARNTYLAAAAGDTTAFLMKQVAGCYERMGMDDSAMVYYRKAILLDPDDYQPVFRLANLYKNQDDYENGILLTDPFLLKHPDNRDVSRLSGYLHYLTRNYPMAVERFRHSADLQDTSAFVYKYLGYSYFKSNKYPEAIAVLEKVYMQDSSDAELCYVLGIAHDVPENIRYFNAAIRLASPVVDYLSDVYQDLALALTKIVRYNEALALLLKAHEITPQDPNILYKIAVHFENWLDNKSLALKYYRDFLAARPENYDPKVLPSGPYPVDPSYYSSAERSIKALEEGIQAPPAVSDSTSHPVFPPAGL